MKNLSRSFLVLLLAALPAFAEFEGVMDMKITMTDKDGGNTGGGDVKVLVGKPGYRTEMNMQAMQMTMKFVMLAKTDKPDLMYRIDDAGKTYTEIDLAKIRDMAG